MFKWEHRQARKASSWREAKRLPDGLPLGYILVFPRLMLSRELLSIS